MRLNEYSEMAENCVVFLKTIHADGLANKINLLFNALARTGRASLRDAVGCYVDMAHRLIQAVAVDGHPSVTLYDELRGLRRQAQNRLQSGVWVPEPNEQWDQDVLETLHHMGGLQRLSSGTGFSFFLIPEMLPLALRLLSALDGPARRKHVNEIAAIRGETVTSSQLRSVDDSIFKEVAECTGREVRKIVARKLGWKVSVADLEAVRVQYLPTAIDFYEAGIRYYQNPAWRDQRYYIFATTSGVILPQERFGSDFFRKILRIPTLYEASGKNPIRESYFRVLAGSSALERMYFFEWERASTEYRKTLKDIEREAPLAGIDPTHAVRVYQETAIESITSFLRKTRFGLVGVDYFPREYDYLTLGNGQAALLSGRDQSARDKIGHGFMLHPKPGAMTQIKQWFSGEALLKDFIPRGHLSTPEIDSLFLLASAGVRAFIPIVIGSLREQSRRRRVKLAIDMLARLREAVDKGEVACEVIELPHRRISHVKEVAESILERLNEGIPPRPLGLI